jgi:cell division protease FtsH
MPCTISQIPAIRLNRPNTSARATAPIPGRAHSTTPNAIETSPAKMNAARVPAGSTEMDGFTGTEGVVVLAAANRPEILDSALLCPGRFDRRVTVSAPDQRGRRQILAVHTRDVPLAPGVDLDALAAATPGMVGADLANLVNEAALRAARRGEDQVTMADFSDSLEKIVLGTARGIVLPSQERERTAFHESGHALLGMLTPGADPVRKISIIARGQALGVTYQAPDTDRYG